MTVPKQQGWPPRWLTKPSGRKTRGPHVCKFMEDCCRATKDTIASPAGQSIVLRYWQHKLFESLFAELPDGRLRYRQGLIGIARKNGKALDVETPMLTARGWVRMGDLVVGDLVYAPDGNPTSVTAVSERWNRPCYRVTFADGAELIASDHHLWAVNDRLSRKPRCVVDTATLAATLHSGARGDRRYTVDVPRSLNRRESDLPLDPYLLGVWLGDGATRNGRVTSADPEIWAAFEHAGFTFGRVEPAGRAETRTVLGLQRVLRAIGVLGNKHAPEEFLLGSEKERLALLRGLMDSDGTVTRGPNTPRVEFSSKLPELAEAVQFLARSLGWKATVLKRPAMLNGRQCGWRHRVGWTAFREESPFSLDRKTCLLAPRGKKTRSNTNAIVSVEPVPTVETVCIAVAHPSHCYLAGKSLTPTHNTALGAGIGLYGLVLGVGGGEVYSVAGDKEQARICFGMARRMVELDEFLTEETNVYRDAIEHTPSGSVYRVLSSDAPLKEGLSPTLVVFDEVHVQPNDDLWSVMNLGSGARREAMVLGITTAGARLQTDGNPTLCYRLYEYGKKVASGEVKDDRFFFAWWEPKTAMEADWRKPATWKEANPGFDDIVAKDDFQASFPPKVPEHEFRTKRTNLWVDASESNWLSDHQGAWSKCEAKKLELGDKQEVTVGVDMALKHDSTAVVIAGEVGERIVVRAKVWEPQGGRIDHMEVMNYLREVCTKYQVRTIAYDPRFFEVPAQMLLDEGFPMVEVPQSVERMVPACGHLFDLIIAGKIAHNGDYRLADHVQAAIRRDSERGWSLSKGKSRRHIDACIAMALACHELTVPKKTVEVFAAWA